MIDTQSLYDTGTKRVCPKRCANTVSQMQVVWTTFLLSILKSINERLTALEQRIQEVHQPCLDLLYSHLSQCESRMAAVHRLVQDQYIQAYVPLTNRTSELLEASYDTSDRLSDHESGDSAPASMPTPISKQESVPTPTPTQSQTWVPEQSATKASVPCLEIDLCDGAYANLAPFARWLDAVARPLLELVEMHSWPPKTIDPKLDPKGDETAMEMGSYYVPLTDLHDEIETEE